MIADPKIRATDALSIALVGNPNVGKTTLFNALSGLRQHTANYPGVTVDIKKARLVHQGTKLDFIDLPGAYSLAARSPDELIPTSILLGLHPGESRPDLILAVLDATNLERNLYLLHQILEIGLPVVGCLTMMDMAAKAGISWDIPLLEARLGIPILKVNPVKGDGIQELLGLLRQGHFPPNRTAPPRWPASVQESIASLKTSLQKDVPDFLLERALFDPDGEAERVLSAQSPGFGAKIQQQRSQLLQSGFALPQGESQHRYREIRDLLAGVQSQKRVSQQTLTDTLDAWLTYPVTGTLAFLLAMFLLFESVFLFATPAMEWLSGSVDQVGAWVGATLPPGPFTDLLTDGIIKGVGGIIVFLPQICILFAMLALLEDSGYMARAAFLVDNIMSRCGLSGKSFIPLLSSLACAVPGIMSTRVIEDRRDRFATILVAPLMSCSARLPVYTLIVAACFSPLTGHPEWLGGFLMFCLYMLGLILAPLVALLLKWSILKGPTPLFVLELPQYQIPSLKVVLRKVWDASLSFLTRAGTTILAAMVVVWALLYFPTNSIDGTSYPERIQQLKDDNKDEEARILKAEWLENSYLGRVGKALEPVVQPIGWDWRLGVAALASFPAREVVVGTLNQLYSQEEDEENEGLTEILRPSTPDQAPKSTALSPASGLSLMVFFALCCQCVSTLVVIRRETNSWFWPVFTFVYMTLLAYLGAWVAYRIGLVFWP